MLPRPLIAIALLIATLIGTPAILAQAPPPTATAVPTPTPVSGPAAQLAPALITPTPERPAAPVPPADGAIESLRLVHSTPGGEYYALTYWSDGLRVAGFLGWPKGPGPYPAIIHNRGGFRSTGALTGGELAPYVEAGYVAVASQYRGNGGGEGFEDFGGRDVDDVLNLIPLLQALPQVDPARIGMFGGSRGGMMALIALKRLHEANRADVRAVVTVGAITDLFGWDAERGGALADILWRPLIGTTPQENPAPFIARSAIFWPETIDTPLLLLHGDADQDVSVRQARALAEKLTAVGVTFGLIIFPGGDHPLWNYDGGYPQALEWFDRFLGNDGVDRSYATHAQAIKAAQAWFAANPQTGR